MTGYFYIKYLFISSYLLYFNLKNYLNLVLLLCYLMLTLHVPCISESCTEIKIQLNFYFHTFLGITRNILKWLTPDTGHVTLWPKKEEWNHKGEIINNPIKLYVITVNSTEQLWRYKVMPGPNPDKTTNWLPFSVPKKGGQKTFITLLLLLLLKLLL